MHKHAKIESTINNVRPAPVLEIFENATERMFIRTYRALDNQLSEYSQATMYRKEDDSRTDMFRANTTRLQKMIKEYGFVPQN